uniref:ATP synthase F0 subunit 8 n=1 Tax=Leptopsylla segnis TaxID=360617 RepID=UPI0023F300FE|nr:ATP synthase F0 subunit 8 [Leptopsylla segnis]WEF75062.1 ATP synthase F0 subunit 8 [Leptopsylla segnis]
MPQMAPMLWLLLMIFFILTLFLFMMLIFYSITTKSNSISSINKMAITKLNWKW